MLRFLKHRRFRLTRRAITFTSLVGMCAQMWYVPELLAQHQQEEAAERAQERAAREQRLLIDPDLRTLDRQQELDRLLAVTCDRISRHTGRVGPELRACLGDLAELRERSETNQRRLQAQIARVKGSMQQAGIGRTTLQRLDELAQRTSDHHLEVIRGIDLVRKSGDDRQSLRRAADQLRGAATFTRPQLQRGESAPLPREAIRQRAKRTSQAPYYRWPWQLAGRLVRSTHRRSARRSYGWVGYD